ncbi:MAG TPA: ATP-binding protein [Kofleriaceae bacterium]|nr:ATP-binding protein [Kofleriaceae bacterium]
MKLRTRLVLLSATQLVVLGLLFAVGYIHVRGTVIPMVLDDLRRNAEQTASSLGAQLDVPLGAGDPALIEKQVAELVADPDFQFVEVLDADGHLLYQHGERPDGELASGPARLAVTSGETIRAWAGVSLEGLALGRVSVVYQTARIERIRVWQERLGAVAGIAWFAAIAYTLRFSSAFVTPIRRMMEFSRKVASGMFQEKLSCGGPGELKELEEYLNAMARELEEREKERRVTAARAETMQQELLAVSRMAGMAEVATGVLHNVGNVLTSLNVSVSVVGEKIRGSKVAALSRSVALFSAHPGGLAGFLATERGALFPHYLATVSQHLAEENAQLLAELDSAAQNVEHIKTIVAMQQSYARMTAYREQLDMAALLDDALRMAEGSFARHGIELVKDYASLPAIVTDRHKLLQIIVNVMSNARHAIKDSPSGGGRITVRLRRDGDRSLVMVQDNGVGIPAAHLARIFQHGFTTKKGGHGFGLHCAANFARELGGKLVAASDGPDRGATFTLELPLAPPEQEQPGVELAS